MDIIVQTAQAHASMHLHQQQQNAGLASAGSDSGLALMDRFEPGTRRSSMLSSLRVLNGTVTDRQRDESRRRRRRLQAGGSERRGSDPLPVERENPATSGTHHRTSRRGSLFEEPSGSRSETQFKRSRKRANFLSVPDILEEETEEVAPPPLAPRGPLRSGRRASSRLLPSLPKDGSGEVTSLTGPDTRGSFLATGNFTNSFRARMQQARKSRREKLRFKFKSYSRLVVFLHRLCKNHFLSVDDSGHSHRGKYISDGQEEELLFDVRYFRAHKEAGISPECKKILSSPSHQRSDKEEYRVLIALRNFPTFAEFPLGMQQEIVKVGWYERYHAQRVILRQGHRPLNFYFIMTGSVVVRVLEEGSDTPRTIVYLNRGETFGELGLVNRERRKSTVISRESVELLCIGDEDYTRIFMAGGLQTLLDPNQSDFIRNLTFLQDWPMHLLAENPKKCIFSYFKRGDVLVKNSKKSDWILIVKSGSCSVMKLLHKQKAKEKKRRRNSETAAAPDLTTEGHRASLRGGTLEDYQERKTRDEFEHFMKDLNIDEEQPANQEPREHSVSESIVHAESPDHGTVHEDSPSIDAVNSDAGKNRERRSGRPVFPSQHSNVHLSRQPSLLTITENTQPEAGIVWGAGVGVGHHQSPGQKKTVATEIVDEISRKEGPEEGTEPVWVQIQTLTKGSYFGLSDMLFDDQPSFSVISNGAECILVSKKFYREHATSRMLTRLRREEQSYPDDRELQKNLEVKLQWDSFKKGALLATLKRSRKRNSKQR